MAEKLRPAHNAEFPEDWDYEKNDTLRPENVIRSSTQKVWWRCKNGHSYLQAVVKHLSGSRCPYCYGNQVLPGFNDLGTANPVFLKEWDEEKNLPATPADFRMKSGRKVWWKCERGHGWLAAISARADGTGCPYCSGNRVLPGFNDLKTVLPEAAEQWDYERNGSLSPLDVTAGSKKKVWWKCKLGHRWETAPVCRSRGTGCPYCGGGKVLAGFNDLQSQRPELAKEWDYERNGDLTPDMVTKSSGRKVWWRCVKGHSWRTGINNRYAGRGCPYCSRYFVIPGETDLATLAPELAPQWDYEKNYPLTPANIAPNSNKQVWWTCSYGHSWRAVISARVAGNGCPYCAGKKFLRTFFIS